ncbi:MAG: hypothetical protein U5K56_12190 [Halioglobus sp.]|nr:hypothetical protein [Halioglobus sp.]
MREGRGLPHILDYELEEGYRRLLDDGCRLDYKRHLLVVRCGRSEGGFRGRAGEDRRVPGRVPRTGVPGREAFFWRSGSRLQAKDVDDPNAYEVRKAKVGGYRITLTTKSWLDWKRWWTTGSRLYGYHMRRVFIVVVNPNSLFWKVRDRIIGKSIQRF